MRLWPIAVALPVFAFLAAARFNAPLALNPDERPIDRLTECPHDWSKVQDTTNLAQPFFGPNAANSVAGPKTDVPEFHDCQRLIKDGQYGPLVAVFVSDSADSLVGKLHLRGVSVNNKYPVDSVGRVANAATDMGVAALQVVNTGARDPDYTGPKDYPPLDIPPGIRVSCIYLYSDGVGWNAWKKDLTYANTDCPRRLSRGEGQPMVVSAYRRSDFAESDYPAVARWEWDGTEYFIGTKCGQAWCQISKMPKAYMASMSAPTGVTSHLGRRTYELKGWYDEQPLMKPTGGSPLLETAIVIPDSLLDRYPTVDVFRNRWVRAATVLIRSEDYGTKANFRRAVPGGLRANTIFFRMLRVSKAAGRTRSYPRGGCARNDAPAPSPIWSRWWDTTFWEAMIVPSDLPRHDCRTVRVKRCPGLMSAMPSGVVGTARWRWMKKDETIWAACAQGCCQLEIGDQL